MRSTLQNCIHFDTDSEFLFYQMTYTDDQHQPMSYHYNPMTHFRLLSPV